jgi:ATP sulfurylase
MWQAGCGTGYQIGTQFQDKVADTVYAFQMRNPTHSGHAYLMKSAVQDLRYKICATRDIKILFCG